MGTVDDYLAGLDPDVQQTLRPMARLIRDHIPEVEQGTSYGMAAFFYRGKPFMALKSTAQHLSLYPFSGAIVEAVAAQLEGYSMSKGTVRFCVDQQIPDAVLTTIIDLRRAEIDALGQSR